MSEKRFTVHIKWFNYDKTEGEITLKDNGQPLLESECIEDVQNVKLLLNELNDENEQLKQELIELKKWEKYVGDVKREDLDEVFKMSIYEIAEAFAYYEKRIKELEE